jgi:hypothetical protein
MRLRAAPGGKTPIIVAPDADLGLAVATCADAAFFHQGQARAGVARGPPQPTAPAAGRVPRAPAYAQEPRRPPLR